MTPHETDVRIAHTLCVMLRLDHITVIGEQDIVLFVIVLCLLAKVFNKWSVLWDLWQVNFICVSNDMTAKWFMGTASSYLRQQLHDVVVCFYLRWLIRISYTQWMHTLTIQTATNSWYYIIHLSYCSVSISNITLSMQKISLGIKSLHTRLVNTLYWFLKQPPSYVYIFLSSYTVDQ